MQIKVTLSANAGVCIELAGKKVWVDALHSGKVRGFSTVSPRLQQQMFALAAPDMIAYTHCHGDHYSRDLTRQAMDKWPDTKVVLPRKDFENQILLQQDKQTLTLGDITAEFIRLPHEGEHFADVRHYGLLLSYQGKTILIPADCALASPMLKAAIGDRNIDVAILDFPWITLRKGQQFVAEVIRPKHILAYHLPFAEDDINGYRMSAQRAANQVSGVDIQLLQEPMQSVEINI